MSDALKQATHVAQELIGTVYPRAPARKEWTGLPLFDELPAFEGYAGCAWDVWGRDDQLGTVNLLTESVVKRAAESEIRTGRTVSLNWPVNFPEKPCFHRMSPQVNVVKTVPDATWLDDEIHINSQSGTQWDGMKHFGIPVDGVKGNIFYQNTHIDTFKLGAVACGDPLKIDPEHIKYGIHNWAQHGICGRAVLLDIVSYYTAKTGSLPYDPWTTHPITLAELEDCAKMQGVTFQPADILLIRVGFMQKFYLSSPEEKDRLGDHDETFAGIEQSDEMKRFLWNNHFAAIASDQPALERWPAPNGHHLHSTILGLWGMPIGEFFDLEKLAEVCAETGRYSFFFTSWPLNMLGACASPPNASAIF